MKARGRGTATTGLEIKRPRGVTDTSPCPAARPSGMSTAPSPAEVAVYRALCLLGGLALPATGYVQEALGLDAVVPMWARWAVAALPLAVLGASFVGEAVRRELAGLLYVLLYVLIAWSAALAVLRGMAAVDVLGAGAVLAAVAAVAATGFRRPWPLAAALATAVAASAAAAFLAEAPVLAPPLLAGGMAAVAALLFSGGLLGTRLRARFEEERERRLAVFEGVAEGVLVLEADTLQVLGVNAAYCEATGFSAEEVTSRSLYDLSAERPEAVDRDARRVCEEGRVRLGERRHRRKDGTVVAVDLAAACLKEGRRRVLCLTAYDVTEARRERAEAEAARTEARTVLDTRTAFLDNLSHELRTPLVAITGFVDLLAEGLPPAEQAGVLASLRRSADRLHGTLNAILDLAQIDGGAYALTPEPVAVAEVAAAAAELFRKEAAAKGLALRVEVGGAGPDAARAVVDRTALHRVLIHLLSNAVKFTEAGGVAVGVRADSHRVIVRVRDTGIGIEPDAVPHLFTPFWQADSGHARAHEGSGLGLTLTKRIVDLMGGRIMVKSTPRQGTAVTLAFARTWASPEAAFPHTGDAAGDGWPAEPTTVQPLGVAKPRALLVEDNADTARLIAHLLQDRFDVTTAPEARTALELARGTWFDVLLLDIQLGDGIDGLSLLKRLRAMSAYAFVPALAVTTYTAPGDRERFLAAGFDAYLPKPFTRRELLSAVASAQATRTAVV